MQVTHPQGSGHEVCARFPDAARASEAVAALLAAGIPSSAISVMENVRPPEGRYLWGLAVRIVLWSIPGGAAGAAVGLGLALAGIGPAGASGAAVQVVSWLIVGHLLAGMWAGYVLLADCSSREMAPDREADATVVVRCLSEVQLKRARDVFLTD